MEFIIIILIIVIIILLTYLFLYHNEVKHISKEIDNIKDLDSNTLIHSKYNLKNINNLRTPLTSSLGYIDIILKSDLSEEEKKKDLITIEKRLRRLEELISSFFEFSRIISTNKLPTLEKINLTSILEESVIVFYDDYKKNNRKILLDCNQRKIIIKVEKLNKVKIIFSNELLDDDVDVDKIFDEFYTVDISRTKEGTGLGLAIAKEFTRQLNGKIYAEKRKGQLKIIIEL